MAKPNQKRDGIRRTIKQSARNARKHADQASSPRKAKRPARARQDDKAAINEQRLTALGRQALIAQMQMPFANANADAAFTAPI